MSTTYNFPTRETTLCRSLSLFVAVWSVLFAGAMFLLSDMVNSRQWTYLLSIQGGKWTYLVVYAIAGLVALVGIKKSRYKMAAWGLGISGATSCLIASFYTVAPLVADGLVTLGMAPWFFVGLVSVGAGVFNASDRAW
jgi:hypothetical protein